MFARNGGDALMRIGIAGFLHESNTFSPEATTVRHFEEASFERGDDLLPVWRDAHHELGGFIEGCGAIEAKCVPLLAATATPKGPLTYDAYEAITADLLEAIRRAGPLDGILLALHGAMVAEGFDSADSETLARVRSVIGPDLPLIVSLDMHANIAPPMTDLPTATIAYRSYPHVDQRARGVECARLMGRVVRGEARPEQACCKLPMLIHIVRQYTGAGAMAEIREEIERTASLPGMLSASIAPGYIYADVPHLGVSVIAIADGDRARAMEESKRLAQFVFDRREQLNAALPDVETAVHEAAPLSGTVCLMDSGDNIGAGAPGDSAVIFHEIRQQGLSGACIILCDPDAARACEKAGEGGRVALEAGGKGDPAQGGPARVEGTVRSLSDGRFVEPEARHGGMRENHQGLTAVVDTDDGHTVVINSLRIMPVSLEQLKSAGVDPRACRFIIVKGVTAPLAAYAPIASAIIAVDSPGVTQAGPETFAYELRPRPLYPLDPLDAWTPEAWAAGAPRRTD